jgi:hypothetical protein
VNELPLLLPLLLPLELLSSLPQLKINNVKIKRRQLRNKLTDWNSIKRHKKQAKNVYEPKLRPSEIGITAPEVQEKVSGVLLASHEAIEKGLYNGNYSKLYVKALGLEIGRAHV